MYRLWYGSTIILLLITVLNSVSVYEQFLNNKLKILQVYYSHKEHLARVAAVHNGVMNYIRTKQEIRLAFYKLIRCPFVLVGSIGGAVERGATTVETVFLIVESGVQSLTNTIPYILGILALLLLYDIAVKLRKNLIRL